MKLGIILSVVIVLVLAAVLFFTTQGVADLPTGATRGDKLEKVSLPPGLPRIVEPGDPTIEASRAYDKVFALYTERRKDFDRDPVPPMLADQLTGLVIDALPAGKFSEGFIDEFVPVNLLDEIEFREALEVVAEVVGKRVSTAIEKGDIPYAAKASYGLWAMGQRLFEHTVRMHNRRNGLIMMKTAGAKLATIADKLPERPKLGAELGEWATALQKIEAAWNDKLKIILVPETPSVADLAHIARDDKDPSFRVEAMLYLGVAKFNPKSPANKRMVLKTIKDGMSDPDPLIAKAATAADAMTKEEMRKMK